MKTELKFGVNTIIIDKIHNKEEFNTFLKGINIKPPFIVKPNCILLLPPNSGFSAVGYMRMKNYSKKNLL